MLGEFRNRKLTEDEDANACTSSSWSSETLVLPVGGRHIGRGVAVSKLSEISGA